ncbi:kinase-like domain-containing protein [Kalaharituber pfeilii]|nr:kinase-like domain-containing protein [Kalaharituber pfeilii]
MSTPSTATVLPLANPYYNSHHNHLLGSHPHLASGHQYTSSSGALTNGASITQAPPSSSSAMGSRVVQAAKVNGGRPRKPVDWQEYFKNGVPDEIIVIDDSPPPSSSTAANRAPQPTARNGPSSQSTVNGNISRHADKKRRTGNTYEPVYPGAHYSATQTPLALGPGSPTVTASSSTAGRNSSAMISTAPTSAGSSGITSTSTLAYPAQSGAKRKRMTRSTAAAAVAAASGDAYQGYYPPPKPPIKAKEVYVQTIPDRDHPKPLKVDDDDGHYIVHPDADLTQRYKITKLLGQGTFGKVVEAYDKYKQTSCAIKVIRSVQKYRDASRIELRVLSTLQSNDKENRNKCIHLRDCFDYRNHICIVTDLLGMSVFDFLKSNNFAPFPNSHIQSFARQLLTSVAFLHDLNLIHTDLKPENILLVHNDYHLFNYGRRVPSSTTAQSRTCHSRRVLLDTEIRLIDFGSATFDDEYHSAVVSTRHYRAPEIILGLGWSFPCDIWSIGCILVEFFTGDALFQTHDNLEHLAMMQAVVGTRIDPRLIRQVLNRGNSAAAKYFKGTKIDYPNPDTTRASRKYVQCMKKLDDIIPQTNSFYKQFLDLLKKIFIYDASKRITAKEALRHPWFKEVQNDEGAEAARIRLENEKTRAQEQQQQQQQQNQSQQQQRHVRDY